MLKKTKYRLNKAIKLIDIYFTVFMYKFYHIKKKNLKIFNKKLSKPLSFNSKLERILENIILPENYKNVIVTCYFIKKNDPQHGNILNDPDINYIKPWYDSIMKNNLNGIIIHDQLPEKFIKQYESKNLIFIKYNPGNYSIFEERWIAYYLLLTEHNIKRAFFTDSNDVYINNNPFEKFKNPNKLYIGRDAANRFEDSGWVLEELKKYENESKNIAPKSLKLQPLYNAGVVGGNKNLLLNLIYEIIEFTFLTKSKYHKDMTLINWSIHKTFKPYLCSNFEPNKLVDPKNDFAKDHPIIFSGFPLNSMFKKFELNSKATFIHK